MQQFQIQIDPETDVSRRFALLEDRDGEEAAGWTIHGVALGADDISNGEVNGESRRVEWPAAVLEAAADSLEGKPVIVRHSDEGTGQIQYPPPQEIVEGRVTKAGYKAGVGVLYEATLADADIARKIEAGVLDVSPELPFAVEDPEADPLVAAEAEFAALAIVSVGAAPSNTAEAGPSEALATLSSAGIDALLSSEPDDPSGEVSEGTQGTVNEPAESGADSTDTNMGDNTPDDPSIDALLERLDDSQERIDDLEDANAQLEQTNATLSERNDTLETEIESVKEAYAAVLSDEGPFDADDLVENFDVATLRERFEDRFEDGFAATLSEPDVQSGADSDDPNEKSTATLSDISDDDLSDVKDLSARAATLESVDEDYANELRAEAAEIAGADDFADIAEDL